MKRGECVWSRVVQMCGVLPCLCYESLATPQGACSARKRPAKDGLGENCLRTSCDEAVRWCTARVLSSQDLAWKKSHCYTYIVVAAKTPHVSYISSAPQRGAHLFESDQIRRRASKMAWFSDVECVQEFAQPWNARSHISRNLHPGATSLTDPTFRERPDYITRCASLYIYIYIYIDICI